VLYDAGLARAIEASTYVKQRVQYRPGDDPTRIAYRVSALMGGGALRTWARALRYSYAELIRRADEHLASESR
jgi:hypothetical protein